MHWQRQGHIVDVLTCQCSFAATNKATSMQIADFLLTQLDITADATTWR